MGLDSIFFLLQETEEFFGLAEKGFFSREQVPTQSTKETANHLLFLFCQKYLNKYHSNFPIPRFRNEVLSLQQESYGDQALALITGKVFFSCYSKPSGSQIKVDFTLKGDHFIPIKWDFFNSAHELEYSEEDESRDGKKDSLTKYGKNNCPIETTKDKYGSGIIDEWWFYENCQLARIEYDENRNGFRERVCYFSLGKPKFCEGVGEKEEAQAKSYKKEGQFELASAYYGYAIAEILKENPMPSPRTCPLLREKSTIDFERKDYRAFEESIPRFLKNPHCEKEKLEILGYLGFYELYFKKDPSQAKITYRKAQRKYQEERGEAHPEIVLHTALAELQSGDPLSCLLTLELVNEKTLPDPQFFFWNYYRGSCYLELDQTVKAKNFLTKALQSHPPEETWAYLHWKLALVTARLGNPKEAKGHLGEALKRKPEWEKNVANQPDLKNL